MNKKRNRIGLTTKYMLLVCVAIVGVNIITGFVLVSQSRAAMLKLVHERMLDISNTAAASLDGDLLESITASDDHNDRYDEIADTLILFQENAEISYIYTIQQTGDEEFAFIIDPDPVSPGEFGESVVTTEALCNAANGSADVDKVPFQDRWGVFYSSYSPVFDSKGNVAGMVGVDFDASWMESQLTRYTTTIFGISMTALIICLIITMIISTKLTGKFESIYSELGTLTKDLERLNMNIIENPDFQGLLDPEEEMAAHEKGTDIDTEDLSEDALAVLSNKLHVMHSEMNQYLEFVHKQAYTDPLTGVGNRTAYVSRTKDMDGRISEDTADFSVCLIDINGLRKINDTFGHESGDIIICDSASILKRTLGAENVFRIGGDEFVVIIDRSMTLREIDRLFGDIDDELIAYNQEVEDGMRFTFAKGGAVYRPGADKEFKDVFRRAAAAQTADRARYESDN